MKGNRLIILGVLAAIIMAVSATATTFAFDSRFQKLDWSRYGDQAYGYAAVRGAPNTGDGSTSGSTTMREWLIIGIVAAGALTAGAGSFALLRRRQS